MYDTSTKCRIDELRQIAIRRDLTLEESTEFVSLVRQGRISAATISAKSRGKKAAAKEIENLDLLEGLF